MWLNQALFLQQQHNYPYVGKCRDFKVSKHVLDKVFLIILCQNIKSTGLSCF